MKLCSFAIADFLVWPTKLLFSLTRDYLGLDSGRCKIIPANRKEEGVIQLIN